jgi:tetratricopeptide (TPR) repeat protein
LFNVRGFTQKEAEAFVQSRAKLLELDAKAYSDNRIRDLVAATDGSPLFMEDLMRLTKVLPVDRAIAIWQERRGDEARRYALQRELEHLSDDAKAVLIAAALNTGPISLQELETVIAISEERLISALAELQTLFLFPKPKVVEGEQRFEINSNTRKLVNLVESGSDFFRRIETKHKALSGQLPEVGRGIVSSLIRQAYLSMNAGKLGEAETLLLNAREKYMNVADLHGFIGFLYRRWTPPRLADARAAFEMAYKLKSKNIETYRHWVKMESDSREWSRAVDAAEKGLKQLPGALELKYLKAVAKTMLGRDFASRLQNERAVKAWTETKEELLTELKSASFNRLSDRSQKAAVYRSLVICLRLLSDVQELNRVFPVWAAEHPDDPFVESEYERIKRRFGSAFEAELPSIQGWSIH